ncbi:hypothetical protein GXW82_41645 [Streptacidiphilus sp. 4-A2]|nr:hypothetical protein [Streptacidiphilus sp. 4-A2]
MGVLLSGTALLAPLYQVHLATETSLQKHVGFGLFFAAPMAGVGVTRLMGRTSSSRSGPSRSGSSR